MSYKTLLFIHNILTFGFVKKYPEKVKAFGWIIRKLRQQKGYSQQLLADECDIERRTLTRIEAGEIAATLHNVCALAEALEIKVSELFQEVEKQNN